MPEAETVIPEPVSSDAAVPEAQPRDPSGEFVRALDEILLPSEGGEIRFGARNEALRLSQIEALTAMRNCVAHGTKIAHIVQPGGTGKARVGIVAADAMHRHERSTLFVVPSQQSVEDFAQKARDLCPDLDVGTVYQVEKRIGRLTFITYASLLRCILGETVEAEAQSFEQQLTESDATTPVSSNGRRVTINPADYDLVIWDEAHKYLTTNAQRLLQRFNGSINIGLTATPRYYQGKEVRNVFGEQIHELDLQKAVERKEISDFRNLLITTDVTTGLELSSPDQEESAEVARAIDIPARNRIFPDMYQKSKIRVGEKDFTLAGEPTIVFGASINHVHDLAQAFNDTLTEALRTDEEFRAALRAKGIDPDQVEQIAAPIHSGGTEDHEPMSLDARNRLVQRYTQRKVLVLVATSVLQESFDSPITSVVMDSVPRQTYVGVGQAGMRALRYLANKEMAFIINTQDADHTSLTFLDFQAARGREEGVAVEIGRSNGGDSGSRRRAATSSGGGGATSNYNVSYGVSLVDLAERRRAQEGQIYRNDYETSFRHFTPLGFQRVNQLIIDIAAGDQRAEHTFAEVLQPWIARTRQRIEAQVFENPATVDEQALEDAVTDTLIPLIAILRSGGLHAWNRFAQRFQCDLRRRLEKIRDGSNSEVTEYVPDDLLDRVASYDPDSLWLEELREGTDRSLLLLEPRHKDVLLRHLNGETFKDIATSYDRTLEVMRQAFHKAQRRLSDHPLLPPAVREYWEDQERALPIVLRQEAARAREAQRRVNNQILTKIEPELMAEKQIIFDILRGSCEYVPTPTVQEKTGVPERYTKPISDVQRTNMDALLAALDDKVIAQLKAKLPQLDVAPAKIGEFDLAIRELKRLAAQFKEMGGKPLDNQPLPAEPVVWEAPGGRGSKR